MFNHKDKRIKRDLKIVLTVFIIELVPKLNLEKEVKLIQSGEQTGTTQRMIEPYSVTSK